MNRPLEAIEELARLMELDPAYRDYSAALDYAEALWQAGQRDDAIGLLTGLVGVSKRINHRMALAHYLKEQGDPVTARRILEQSRPLRPDMAEIDARRECGAALPGQLRRPEQEDPRVHASEIPAGTHRCV